MFGSIREGASFRTVAVIVSCALFMEQLDSTVLATALPAMARTFGVSAPAMSIALTSYILSLAVFIPISGIIADRSGARRTLCWAIAIFMIGSALCGLTDRLDFLVVSRLVQGAGGAMMVPVARLILLRRAPRSQYVSAFAWFSVSAMLGPMMGPLLGGAIVTYFSWRWIFYVNIPIGMIGLLFVCVFIGRSPKMSVRNVDAVGLVLTAMSLSTLLFGLETLSRGFISGPETIALLGTGVVFGGIYVAHALRHPHPVLDLKLLRLQTFRISMAAGSLTRITSGAYPFLLPLLMQLGFGMTAMRSGAITFVTGFGALAMKAPAPSILRRFGFRSTLTWNAAIASLAIAVCAAFRPSWPEWVLYCILLTAGLSHSLQYAAYGSIAYAQIGPDNMSDATSFHATFLQLVLSMGICVSAAVLRISMALTGHDSPEFGDFSAAFLVVTGISLLAAPLCASLPEGVGDDLMGRLRPVTPSCAVNVTQNGGEM
jgi:EmrB/QacA subfamily drug resistance transporter